MELEQLKEKYESGDYVCYYKDAQWNKCIPILDQDSNLSEYKLIHNKDKAVADAIIANPNVEVEYYGQVTDNGYKEPDLFKNYNEKRSYRLKPQEEKEDMIYVVTENIPKEKEEAQATMDTDSIDTANSDNLPNNIISITSEDGTEYKFEKPEFECELLKVVKENDEDLIVGYVRKNYIIACQWEVTGCELHWDTKEYNLTPIKKQWYEDESNFPCWIRPNNSNHIMYKAQGARKLSNGKWTYWVDCYSHIAPMDVWKPATKEEVLSLVVDV